MVRVVVYLNEDLKKKIDEVRGETPRSKVIANGIQYLADQNYIQNLLGP